eukprot:6224283-Pyramimonas_sp.AAC.1
MLHPILDRGAPMAEIGPDTFFQVGKGSHELLNTESGTTNSNRRVVFSQTRLAQRKIGAAAAQ